MPCPQCGFMIAPFTTTCPRCNHVLGQPVIPYAPPVTPPATQTNTPIAKKAVSAGFFGFIGAWLAALGLGCVIPAVCCTIAAIVLFLLVGYSLYTGSQKSSHNAANSPETHSPR